MRDQRRPAGRCRSPVRLLGDPTVDDVAGAFADVDGVVTDAFVEAGDDGQLHRDLEVDVAGGVALEDDLDELTVQIVEVRVHVVQRRGPWTVDVEVRLGGLLEEQRGLLAASSG